MGATDVSVIHVDTERGWRGGQQQAAYLFRYMLDEGVRTHFICRRRSRMEDYLRVQGLPYHSEPLSGEMDLLSAGRIARFAARGGYRVLYLHSGHAVSIGLLARLMNRGLRTIAVRRVDFSIGANPASRLKYATGLVDRIVAVSENVRDVLVGDGIHPSRVEVIRSGIDIHRFDDVEPDPSLRSELGVPLDGVLVGTVAGMVGHKDYPTLLKASERVIAAEPGVFFVAVGSGPEERKVRALADSLRLDGRFRFLGERRDVGAVLKAMDVFVLASKMEGLGTSVLDAMSVGLPIVATEAGGIPEMVDDGGNGLLVPSEAPDSLSDAIIALARDSEMRQAFGSRSRERVREFDYRLMGARSLKLCRSLPFRPSGRRP